MRISDWSSDVCSSDLPAGRAGDGSPVMRYLSVCSGIEAATVAWHPLGWTPVGFSEIEPFPRAVLEQRHGGVAVDWDHRWSAGQNYPPIFGDFTQIEAHHVGPVDLLVGGTPCQSFSVAGKRLGLDDPRGNLAIERSEEPTSELQSLMRISYAVFCLKKKTNNTTANTSEYNKRQ